MVRENRGSTLIWEPRMWLMSLDLPMSEPLICPDQSTCGGFICAVIIAFTQGLLKEIE